MSPIIMYSILAVTAGCFALLLVLVFFVLDFIYKQKEVLTSIHEYIKNQAASLQILKDDNIAFNLESNTYRERQRLIIENSKTILEKINQCQLTLHCELLSISSILKPELVEPKGMFPSDDENVRGVYDNILSLKLTSIELKAKCYFLDKGKTPINSWSDMTGEVWRVSVYNQEIYLPLLKSNTKITGEVSERFFYNTPDHKRLKESEIKV